MTKELEEKIMKIFFPNLQLQQKRVQNEKKRFVHYTSAEAAMHILTGGEIWLRNAATMNDFREIEHGFDCLNESYKGETGKRFKAVLDSIFPEISQEIEVHFNTLLGHIRRDTFILCVSEHENSEDIHGRLSMWRGYGAADNVAFVMNTNAFFGDADDLKTYTYPVSYLDNGQFEVQFQMVLQEMQKEVNFLKTIDKGIFLNLVIQMFRFASVCTKHPGFYEEKEWRVIHSPNIEGSTHIKKSYQAVNGTPQIVCKIPLKDIPDINFYGATPAALIDRIIIGPSRYPVTMYDTFVKLLTESGVENANEKVFVSDIPLRK